MNKYGVFWDTCLNFVKYSSFVFCLHLLNPNKKENILNELQNSNKSLITNLVKASKGIEFLEQILIL